jgi:hypothetical protein
MVYQVLLTGFIYGTQPTDYFSSILVSFEIYMNIIFLLFQFSLYFFNKDAFDMLAKLITKVWIPWPMENSFKIENYNTMIST